MYVRTKTPRATGGRRIQNETPGHTSKPPPAQAQVPRRGPAIVTLSGTVAEVDARQTTGGTSLVVFRVLVIRPAKSGEAVDDFEILAWGDLAEKVAQHLRVGEAVNVKARLTADWWSDSRGRRHHSLKLTALEIVRKAGGGS